MLRARRMGGVNDTDRACAFAIANAPCCYIYIYRHGSANLTEPNRKITQDLEQLQELL
jgi:hypothetical protein